MRACGRPAGAKPPAVCGPVAHTAPLDASAGRGPRCVVQTRATRCRACRGPHWRSFSFGTTRSSRTHLRAVQPPEESSPSTQVDENPSNDAELNDSFDSDTFDEDAFDDIPVGDTVDMDEAVGRVRGCSWSLRNLEGVMVGASRPLRNITDEVTRWAGASFDDDDKFYKMKPESTGGTGEDEEAEEDEMEEDETVSKNNDDADSGPESSWTAWLSPKTWTRSGFGARGWAARDKVKALAARRRKMRDEERGKADGEDGRDSATIKTSTKKNDWRTAAASWITDDDVETFFLSEPDPLGVGAFFHGVGAWAANRVERSRAAAAAASTPPPLEVVKLSDADRARLNLGCDEMHFLPVPESGWSIALLRYKPSLPSYPSSTMPCITSVDSMFDDSDFIRGTGSTLYKKMPAVFVPGCASNAYTFDVSSDSSLARKLSNDGHDVFIVECRGVGFSRPWRAPAQWTDETTKTPKQHVPTFGDFDYDTYLREDLPIACGYISAVTGEERLCAVGHSMGGMLVMNLASGAVEHLQVKRDEHERNASEEFEDSNDTNENFGSVKIEKLPWAPWVIARSVTVASCLECSDTSDGNKGHSSTYARYAAIAGIVPDYLYGGSGIPQLPLGPLSIGQGMAIEAIKGAPKEEEDDVDKNEEPDTFWERSAVSLSTCYPGATTPQNVRRLLYYGFGNVPLRLVLQMATLFAPGGLATREEALARRDRAVYAAEKRRKEKRVKRSFKGWGYAGGESMNSTVGATVEEVVLSEMTRSSVSSGKTSEKSSKNTKHVLYLDALRERRPKLLMLAGDCDPVIPPTQVEATANAAGAKFVCFGDGPKRGEQASEDAPSEEGDEKEKTNSEVKRAAASRSGSDAALQAMLVDGGTHFSHYDLLCGKKAPALVFPEVSRFLGKVELFGGKVEL